MAIDIFKVKKGDKIILKYPNNGYDSDVKFAKGLIDTFGPDYQYTLKSKDINTWNTTFRLEEVSGNFNSVQFEFADDEELETFIVEKTVDRFYQAKIKAKNSDEALKKALEKSFDGWIEAHPLLTNYDVFKEDEI